jgi:hypothetical protein
MMFIIEGLIVMAMAYIVVLAVIKAIEALKGDE